MRQLKAMGQLSYEMTRLRRAVLCVALLVLGACSEATNGTGMISKRIGEVIAQPDARDLDLAKLTSFGWDHFYVLQSGTSREQICEFIGASRKTCGRIVRYQVVPADSVALVFGLNGNLTHIELHALVNGQFQMPTDARGWTREEAVFAIRRIASGTPKDTVVLEKK
jgi:hypothetical protein